MAGRRELSFGSLDDVMPEVERLLVAHKTVGQWSLGQILNHLSAALRLTVRGAPSTAEPTEEQNAIRKSFLSLARFPDGRTVPGRALDPKEGLDAHTEAKTLHKALAGFAAHSGPLPAHPKLGPMTKEEWGLFHRMHCAHHLGFAVPD